MRIPGLGNITLQDLHPLKNWYNPSISTREKVMNCTTNLITLPFSKEIFLGQKIWNVISLLTIKQWQISLGKNKEAKESFEKDQGKTEVWKEVSLMVACFFACFVLHAGDSLFHKDIGYVFNFNPLGKSALQYIQQTLSYFNGEPSTAVSIPYDPLLNEIFLCKVRKEKDFLLQWLSVGPVTVLSLGLYWLYNPLFSVWHWNVEALPIPSWNPLQPVVNFVHQDEKDKKEE